ncbi:hypothetical protein EDB82DRAFT_473676 [Fusarium venenatum]|uniref:uncharacterized protein n=1 Tax=Fusarium venenatum TaxID=56646 RepID=UPI001DE5577F|nr:hypothetical protein EDB82DRAFT_473676 [Fusarium venenatum]
MWKEVYSIISVRRWLERSRNPKPIYAVTGLKVVTGAVANSIQSRIVGGNVSVGVDGIVWTGGAVPLGGGPGIEVNIGNNHRTRWKSGNFVFNYRMWYIYPPVVQLDHVRRRSLSKETNIYRDDDENEYTRGVMLGTNSKACRQAALDIISVADPRARDKGLEEEKTIEGDKEILCAILHHEDLED